MNNNIKESYCSFEVSKLLKEKGFDVPCLYPYLQTGVLDENREDFLNGSELFIDYNNPHYMDVRGDVLSAPTHTLAIEWLRVNFNLYITIEYLDSVLMYGAIVTTIKDNTEQFERFWFGTPQEATEAALLYTLNNLI